MNITEFKYRCSSDKEAVVLYRYVIFNLYKQHETNEN